MKLVLASASPRRSELLKLLGHYFEIRVPNVDESIIKEDIPQKLVCELAKLKAENVKISGDEIIISADTVVTLDDIIYGKPSSKQDAFNMLNSLSGKTHKVFTGVCIKSKNLQKVFYCDSNITFYELTHQEIWDYINTGEPMDKAGSYGIQGFGSLLVKEIQGDYFNIVGLPISKLNRELKEFL